MENQPGNGYLAPFGNEKGATQGGPSSGAHDFTTDPKSHSPATGGRDFSKESRSQPASGDQGRNPDTVPAGGDRPFSDTDPKGNVGADGVTVETPTSPRKPFRLGGGEAPAARSAPMSGEMPDEGY